MGRKYYELLSIDSVDTLRSRMFFKRESSDDSYSMHLEDGLIEMKRRMRELIEDGVTFRNCIVTGHGSSGHIKVCSDSITRRVWYDHFYRQGFDRLFPAAMAVSISGAAMWRRTRMDGRFWRPRRAR